MTDCLRGRHDSGRLFGRIGYSLQDYLVRSDATGDADA